MAALAATTRRPTGGREVSVEELAAQMASNPATRGLTLSGGDPFLQAAECAALARLAHTQGRTVWVYTGYLYEHLIISSNQAWLELLDETDVLVDGPFVQALKSYAALFRGSSNQRLIDVKRSRAAGRAVLWERADPLAHFTVPES